MCSEAYIRNGKQELYAGSQGELKAALGLNKLPLRGNDKKDQTGVGDKYCLCPIDIEKAGEMAGYKVEYDFINYYLIRPYGGHSSNG